MIFIKNKCIIYTSLCTDVNLPSKIRGGNVCDQGPLIVFHNKFAYIIRHISLKAVRSVFILILLGNKTKTLSFVFLCLIYRYFLQRFHSKERGNKRKTSFMRINKLRSMVDRQIRSLWSLSAWLYFYILVSLIGLKNFVIVL